MLDKSKLVEIIKSQVPVVQNLHLPVLSPEQLSLMKGGELTNNQLLCVALGAKAEEMGYTVTTNTSSIPGICNSHSTKYFNSRPDLAMYKGDRMYIVMGKPSEESTQKGGMTENKNKIEKNKNDVEGQLLVGMEKMAGDLAYQQLQSGRDPKQKRYQHIKIYGLVVDYASFTSKAYQLNMDFVAKCSILYTSLQELNLNMGVNRLISCLKSNYA